MLSGIQAESLTRIAATRSVLRVVDNYETTVGSDDASRSLKGLIFVQNYAAYEYVVSQSVRQLVAHINARGLNLATTRPQLLAMALNPEFSSVIKGSSPKTWGARMALLITARSASAVEIEDGLFPKDGSHFRPEQLETLWAIFGFPGPIVSDKRHLSMIIEMVDTRNRIAHGNESPAAVGGGFSVLDLSKRIDETEAVCTHITTTISAYILTPAAFT